MRATTTRTRTRAGVLVATVAVLAACGSAASPSSSSKPGAASPTASAGPTPVAGTCPIFDPPADLGPAFLDGPTPPAEGLIVQVLVAVETGEVDLGRSKLLFTTEMTGAAPVHGADWRAIAFETTSGDCAFSLVLDDAILGGGFKGGPLALELATPVGTITASQAIQSGNCTALATGTPGRIGIECFGIKPADASGRQLRIWIGIGWPPDAITEDDLPGWAITALGGDPTPAPSGGTDVSLRVVDDPAFLLTQPQFPDGTSLLAQTVAAGEPGWVIAGGYLPFGWGSLTSEADAVVWHSPDGLTWGRIVDPDLGGPGNQMIETVLHADGAWVAWGLEASGPEDAPTIVDALWTSVDGRDWQRREVTCPSAPCPAAPGHARAAIVSGELVLLGATTDGQPGMWTLDEGLRIGEGTLLRRPAEVGPAAEVSARLLAQGPEGYLLVGSVWEDYTPSIAVWRSADRTGWVEIPLASTDLAAESGAVAAIGVDGGWLVGTEAGVFRLAADGTVVRTLEMAWVSAFLPFDGSLLAVGQAEPYAILLGTDGAAVASVSLVGDPREPTLTLRAAASSDGRVVVVGSRGADAGVWLYP